MNGKRSSVIWLLAAVLLAGLLLTSCGSAGKSADPASSAAADSTELPTGADGETVSDLYRRAHEKFLPYYEKGHAEHAYGAVSALMTYGGNSGGSASLEWQYVQAEIFYRELYELRDHLR